VKCEISENYQNEMTKNIFYERVKFMYGTLFMAKDKYRFLKKKKKIKMVYLPNFHKKKLTEVYINTSKKLTSVLYLNKIEN
jgi:hypothetical protein